MKQFIGALEISTEYNRYLFEQLTSITDTAKVTEEVRKRIVETGTFLQSHEIKEPLTRETIRELNSKMWGAQYRVRESLKNLAEHLLGPDVNHVDPSATKELVLICQLPGNLRPFAQRYIEWLRNERKDTHRVRLNHLRTLRCFWWFCDVRQVTYPASVRAQHIAEFLYILSLNWKCSKCSTTKNLSAKGEAPPTVCENPLCGASGPFNKVVRCLPVSISGHRARLRIFFDWLKDVEHEIEVNPAEITKKKKKRRSWSAMTKKTVRTIQYYDWKIIDSLLNAVEINALDGTNVPVAETFALYLVLHHGFYVYELRTVQIPLECRPLAVGGPSPMSLEKVLRLEWRPRELSRNRQFVGRTGDVFEMQPANEPWLSELTAQFMRDRNMALRDLTNPYLFVCRYARQPCQPVGMHYIWRLIQKASARITGRVCNPNILAKCSRLLYSEFGGYEGWRHLRELGLCETHARRYAWAQRIRVVPKAPGEEALRRFSAGNSPLVLPPTDIFGMPAAIAQ